ncbi:GSCOCG00008028001-RA-CDS, partial [Cotesia congregata]
PGFFFLAQFLERRSKRSIMRCHLKKDLEYLVQQERKCHLYEVVNIQSPKLQKRSVEAGHHIKIQAFSHEIEHYLTPLNDLFATENTPIKEAMYDSKKRKLVVRRSSVSMAMVSQHIYQEKSYRITLSVKIHRGRREISGIIGYKNWHVSPMPERLRRSLNQNRSNRSVDDEIDSDDIDKSYHIISQLPNTDGQNLMARK